MICEVVMTFMKTAGIVLFLTAFVLAKPEWIEERPLSGSWYIGIGYADRDEFPREGERRKAAKQRALADIASEISSKIEVQENLVSTADDSGVTSQLKEQIRTRAAADLREYEFVDSWERFGDYYCYYRLNRQVWDSLERARLDRAEQAAESAVEAGDRAVADGKAQMGFQQYTRAFSILIPVLHLAPQTVMDEEPMAMRYLIEQRVSNLIAAVNISIKEPFCRGVRMQYNPSRVYGTCLLNGVPLEGFPLRLTGTKLRCDSLGRFHVRRELLRDADTFSLSLTVEPDDLVTSSADDTVLTGAWLAGFNWPHRSLSFLFERPVVLLTATERADGYGRDESLLRQTVADSLTAAGYGLTDIPGEAHILLTLKGDTRRSGVFSGVKFVYADISWNIAGMTGRQRGSGRLEPVKGSGSTVETASAAAYRSAREELAAAVMNWLRR
ncbi:MAG: LPP20 family lipoprotein [Fibrobacterota bacterium]